MPFVGYVVGLVLVKTTRHILDIRFLFALVLNIFTTFYFILVDNYALKILIENTGIYK